MEWLHCNKCYQRINKSLKYFIKECGRIECQKCLERTGDGESNCVACNKSCRTLLLAGDMKPEVQIFFKPIPQLLDNIKKVYEYQMRNYHSLSNHLIHKYTLVKNDMAKSHKLIEAYKKEIEKLKALLKGGQSSTPRGTFHTSTPVEQFLSPSLFNGTLSTVTCTPKTPYPRPGYPVRITSAERSYSTVSSAEHVVPGSRLSGVLAPTHRNGQQAKLMSQMIQNSRQVRPRHH